MNAYEVTLPDGSTHRLEASGWTWDRAKNGIAFYDERSREVAAYRSGEWAALHMRQHIAKADCAITGKGADDGA